MLRKDGASGFVVALVPFVGGFEVAAGLVGAAGLGAGVDGFLVVDEGLVAVAEQIAALAGGEQRANFQLRADGFAVGGGLIGGSGFRIMALAAQGVGQAKVGEFKLCLKKEAGLRLASRISR